MLSFFQSVDEDQDRELGDIAEEEHHGDVISEVGEVAHVAAGDGQAELRDVDVTSSPNVTVASSGPCISMTSIVSVEETPEASRMSDKKPDSGSDKPTGMVRNLTPSKVGGVTQKRRYFKTPEALKTPSYHELTKASQKKTSRKGDSG